MAKAIETQILSKHLLHFEAAARHLNFTAAANELQQSQPAVSHSVRVLEKQLATPLFKRLHRGVQLTSAGQLLFEVVKSGIDSISHTLDYIQSDTSKDNIVTLSLSTATVTYGILPKIGDFKRKHPDIILHFNTHDTDELLGKEEADLIIPLGYFEKPKDFHSWYLTEEVIFPVCAPNYLANYAQNIKSKTEFSKASTISIEDIASLALIHLEERYKSRMTWQDWFENFDFKNSQVSSGTRFNDYSVVIQTALEGQGVVLGWEHIVQPLIEQERLVKLGVNKIHTKTPFYVLAPKKRELSKAATIFRDWLIEEAF